MKGHFRGIVYFIGPMYCPGTVKWTSLPPAQGISKSSTNPRDKDKLLFLSSRCQMCTPFPRTIASLSEHCSGIMQTILKWSDIAQGMRSLTNLIISIYSLITGSPEQSVGCLHIAQD